MVYTFTCYITYKWLIPYTQYVPYKWYIPCLQISPNQLEIKTYFLSHACASRIWVGPFYRKSDPYRRPSSWHTIHSLLLPDQVSVQCSYKESWQWNQRKLVASESALDCFPCSYCVYSASALCQPLLAK